MTNCAETNKQAHQGKWWMIQQLYHLPQEVCHLSNGWVTCSAVAEMAVKSSGRQTENQSGEGGSVFDLHAISILLEEGDTVAGSFTGVRFTDHELLQYAQQINIHFREGEVGNIVRSHQQQHGLIDVTRPGVDSCRVSSDDGLLHVTVHSDEHDKTWCGWL